MTPKVKKKRNKRKNKSKSSFLVIFILSFLSVAGSACAFFLIPKWTPTVYEAPHMEVKNNSDAFVLNKQSSTTKNVKNKPIENKENKYPKYLPTPKPLKAIYMTQCVVGTPSFRADLVKLIEETELNSVIIDIKDYSGKIGYDTDNPVLADSVSDQCGASDIKSFIEMLHKKGIYVMGRITVFQDPYYSKIHPELAVKFKSPEGAVWKDNKGLSFIDVGAKPFWDYIITLSVESRMLGFDEINYDYIRFPSDGPMKNISFDWAKNTEKQIMLEEFFAYLNKEVKDETKYPNGVKPPVISADMFGMVTTNFDDLNIGQVLERAMPYFDYIDPMVYPSHYPSGFNSWSNPNTVPYELVRFALSSAVKRAEAKESPIKTLNSKPIYKTIIVPPTSSTTATTTKKVFTGMYTKDVYDKNKIRPWLQDFDYGGNYGAKEVRDQIRATYDAGLDSWMLWAPSNRYTKSALKSVDVGTMATSSNTDVRTNNI